MTADLVVAERVAVGLGGVGELGRRVADVAAQDEQRRAGPRRPCARRSAASRASRSLATSPRSLDVPAVGLEALGGVVGEGQLGGAVDGDVVVVVDVDEPAEAEVAGERGGLVADALLRSPSRADDEGVVVEQLGAEPGPQPALGDAHADAVGEALAERAGGDLDARRCGATSGWPGVRRAPLAELPSGRRASRP